MIKFRSLSSNNLDKYNHKSNPNETHFYEINALGHFPQNQNTKKPKIPVKKRNSNTPFGCKITYVFNKNINDNNHNHNNKHYTDAIEKNIKDIN
eukprot:Pgem_evm1s7807